MLLQVKNGNLLNSKDDNDYDTDYDEYDFALGDNISVGTYRKLPVITLEQPKLQICPSCFSACTT